MNTDVFELTELLQNAAIAHHEYESKLGQPDKDWAPWYAQWIVDHTDNRPLVTRLQPTGFDDYVGY